ncbi:MAG: ATP-binding protein [Actinomycetes bacterium]
MGQSFAVQGERDVSQARLFVLEECRASVLLSLCDDAALLTSEVVTNAIRHAASGSVTVRAERDGDTFVVQVLDGSRREPSVLPTDPWDERGRGMALVDALALDWGVVPHPSGKVVWFRL